MEPAGRRFACTVFLFVCFACLRTSMVYNNGLCFGSVCGGKSRDSFCSYCAKIDSIQFCLWTRAVNTRNRESRSVAIRTRRLFCWFARLVIVYRVVVTTVNRINQFRSRKWEARKWLADYWLDKRVHSFQNRKRFCKESCLRGKGPGSDRVL